MASDSGAGSQFAGIRGVFKDIRLLLVDMLGLGKPGRDQQMVIEVFFGLMGHLAKSDRLVSSHESDLANAVMDEIDLSLAAREMAMTAFNRGMSRNINARAEVLRFTDVHPAGSEEASRLYDVLLRLAASDGRLDPREYDAMQQITADLDLPPRTLDNRLAQFTIRR